MAGKSEGAGRKGSFVPVFGLVASVAGIIVTIAFYFMLSGLLGSINSTMLGQVDGTIAIVEDTKAVTTSAAESVNSFGNFILNASESIDYTAVALEQMGSATYGLAAGVAAIPYMPYEVVAPMYATAGDMDAAADSLSGTSESMEESSEDMLATALGITALNDDLDSTISDLEKTRADIVSIHDTAQLGLLLGTLMVLLMFAVNGLSFWQQMER